MSMVTRAASFHRWWGVTFCLLFAMWFASGIVMHFVPFPMRHEEPVALDLDVSNARVEQIDHDQWTVAGNFDSDRPLTRYVLNDDAGTNAYVSSRSSRTVLVTTRRERALNYIGSIPHWLYMTELRHHKQAWTRLMWWLSVVGTIGAMIGSAVGILQLTAGHPHRGLRRWHHISGLIVGPIILGWSFSGFLSMDGGWLVPSSDSLFRVLHTLNFGPLASHRALRAAFIVGLCMCGFVFSLTGVGLAWRRLRNEGRP